MGKTPKVLSQGWRKRDNESKWTMSCLLQIPIGKRQPDSNRAGLQCLLCELILISALWPATNLRATFPQFRC